MSASKSGTLEVTSRREGGHEPHVGEGDGVRTTPELSVTSSKSVPMCVDLALPVGSLDEAT